MKKSAIHEKFEKLYILFSLLRFLETLFQIEVKGTEFADMVSVVLWHDNHL